MQAPLAKQALGSERGQLGAVQSERWEGAIAQNDIFFKEAALQQQRYRHDLTLKVQLPSDPRAPSGWGALAPSNSARISSARMVLSGLPFIGWASLMIVSCPSLKFSINFRSASVGALKSSIGIEINCLNTEQHRRLRGPAQSRLSNWSAAC